MRLAAREGKRERLSFAGEGRASMPEGQNTSQEAASRAIIRVGDGRGFVVERRDHRDRLVITAGHCLPFLPPSVSMMDTQEKTYRDLLAPPKYPISRIRAPASQRI
jgi:hypothetical protein